ncbi:MAG: crossover junction endodeoxyribonuclease RuvC [Candidatus Coatesbacteria bacterium]|nr:MAG: crossover junction endodeoxyribonuclease RuvC [Candidatus Coatesbacteria bacterium]
MKILGIDPGLTGSGFGCVESRDRAYYQLYADTAAPAPQLPLPERLAALRNYTLEVLAALQPEAVAVEAVFSHAEFPKTALQMAQARGVILEACAAAGTAVVEYAPRRVKQAVVGAGGASKEQVARMVARHLNLTEPLASQHEADALAVALCAHFMRGRPANSR